LLSHVYAVVVVIFEAIPVAYQGGSAWVLAARLLLSFYFVKIYKSYEKTYFVRNPGAESVALSLCESDLTAALDGLLVPTLAGWKEL
jgi:hypothetical protein